MKVAFVVKINFKAIISTAYLINVLKLFSKNYELTVITNAESYFIKQGIKANFIHIPTFTAPNLSRLIVNDSIINLKLKNFEYDMLVIWYDSLIFYNEKKPVFRFIDICPYQTFNHIMNGNKKRINWNLLFRMYIRSFKKSNFSLTVSPQMKKLLIKYGISKERIDWLTFGVDLDRFSKKYISEKNKIFILISPVQFLPNRGRDLIIDTMQKFSKLKTNIKFISVGNAEDQINLWNNKLKEMNLEKLIKIMGIIDNKKIPELLSKSDIGISILEKNEYYNRSPPQKIFEYMAMGLPIIANNLPTHTDYIKDGYNGFIIDSDEEFMEAILKLKNNKKLYKTMSKNSLDSAKNYDLTKINNKLDKYVKNVLNKQ